jgi:hypothetical protein
MHAPGSLSKGMPARMLMASARLYFAGLKIEVVAG